MVSAAKVVEHEFTPNYGPVATFDGFATAEVLLAEQGMFAASEDFVRAHGGPLARRFMDAVPEDYRQAAVSAGLELNVDLRVHELDVGDFPASPGWHCDSPFREVAFDARAQTRAVQRNLVGTISTDHVGVSNTEFLDEPVTLFSDAEAGSFVLWREVDAHVGQRLERETTRTRDGELTEFDCATLHRATAAQVAGVRMFCRVSLWEPPPGHRPGLTSIEQVYRRVSGLSR